MMHLDSPPKAARSNSRGPDFCLEHDLMVGGKHAIAGVDEAGRGPLAGPVVTAAVRLDPENLPQGLNDSKKLSAKRRDALFTQIVATAQVGIAIAPPEMIDEFNIRGATLWAMARAVARLPQRPHHVLVDGRDVPSGLTMPATALIGGDGRSMSIAAASIVAKVVRDRMCPVMDADSPGYEFDRHKGYGTAIHMSALARFGPCVHHRKSFAPVARAARAGAV